MLINLLFALVFWGVEVPSGVLKCSCGHGDIDDALARSTELIVKREFSEGEKILSCLLKENNNLNYRQKVNVLNGLLELSYINRDSKSADIYGHKLLNLLEESPQYDYAKRRLKERLCESEDWASTRTLFQDVCASSEQN